MRSCRKLVAVATVTLTLGALGACSSERTADSGAGGGETGDTLVGIAMPTRSLQRWNNDGVATRPSW